MIQVEKVKKYVKIEGWISQELDIMVRDKAARKYGLRRGSLSKALEEALKMWLANEA